MTSQEKTREEELRDQITDALVRDVGVSPTMAAPFVESIMQCMAGQRVYFPAPARELPEQEIRRAFENGRTLREVLHDFGVSRRQIYRLFPGGIPAAKRRA